MEMISIDGIGRIDKVVAEFDVWLDGQVFPFPKMKVKIYDQNREFIAFANLRRLHPVTRVPDGTAGIGDTADEALRDLLERFSSEARENMPLNGYVEADFEWSAPEDF